MASKVSDMRKKLMVVALVYLCCVSAAWGWDNISTHRTLTKNAADKSNLASKKGDILTSVGFTNGLEEVLKWPGQACDEETRKTKCTVMDWLRYGAGKEDAESFDPLDWSHRPLNHFHEPITNQGLNGTVLNGMSALQWAQNSDAQAQEIEGDQSWPTLRQLYYLALTLSDKETREETFAQLFKGLGHQMHLVQDMAVPYHVRNDAHVADALQGDELYKIWMRLSPLYFETWAKKNDILINQFAGAAAIDDFPDLPFDTPFSGAPCPISQLWDANVYNDGSNPSIARTQGLSEYTSANFLSEHTIFNSDEEVQGLPYPRRSSTELFAFAGDDFKFKLYLAKRHDGEIIDHFVRVGYLSSVVRDFPVSMDDLSLDENCHWDYAEKLVPRAVGYSAELLNYFFRGEIELVPDAETGHGYVIENKTEEAMNSSFEIYYDNHAGNRVRLWMGVSSLGSMSSGNNQSSNIEIVQPTDAQEPGKYILVFSGDMGNEAHIEGVTMGAVAGGISVLDSDNFIYISKPQVGGSPKSIVWDVARNDYAIINDSQGNIIEFPCDPALLSDWLSTHPAITPVKIGWGESSSWATSPPVLIHYKNLESTCNSSHLCSMGSGSDISEKELCVDSPGLEGQVDCRYYSIDYSCCGESGPYQHCHPNSLNPTWYSADWYQLVSVHP